jgi:hypothetical protein
MKDLTPLHDVVKMCFEEFGISAPAFVIAFTEKETGYKQVFWVSNTSRMDSIKLLEGLLEKMKSELN